MDTRIFLRFGLNFDLTRTRQGGFQVRFKPGREIGSKGRGSVGPTEVAL